MRTYDAYEKIEKVLIELYGDAETADKLRVFFKAFKINEEADGDFDTLGIIGVEEPNGDLTFINRYYHYVDNKEIEISEQLYKDFLKTYEEA